MEWIGRVYSTHQVAYNLNIGRSTVNKYARSLENEGYEFKKGENERRAYTEHDLVTFRALVELLSRGVHYDGAIKSIVERYSTNQDSHYMPIAAMTNSTIRSEVEEKLNSVILAIQALSNRIDNTISERVKSEVTATVEQLNEQVNHISEQVRISKESTEEKLDVLLCRINTYGKKVPWWKFWK